MHENCGWLRTVHSIGLRTPTKGEVLVSFGEGTRAEAIEEDK